LSNALFSYQKPVNDVSRDYVPGSEDRKLLKEAIEEICSNVAEIPLIINGEEVRTGNTGSVVMPHDHNHKLAVYHKAGSAEMERAIKAALDARRQWSDRSYTDRAAIMMRIAELIKKKYRYILNAATMMGQSKNVWQAEIESASETIDYFHYGVHYMSEIYKNQPVSENGVINCIEYRPLEGFVYAVSPFNFTALAANLPMAPVMMGNTVVWKPATTSLLSSYYLMKIYAEAGLPAGVLNFMPGPGSVGSKVVLAHKDLAGVHFTGSTQVFNGLWKSIAENLNVYKSYPRLVGETGGKNFVFMHNSADATEVAAALVRGAFEYQGQKCSATSRCYIPASRWDELRNELDAMMATVKTGDPRDFRNFVNAVIDEDSFENCMKYINYAKKSSDAEILHGGSGDKTIGYFVQPTIIKTTNPHFLTMEEEIFGPILTVFVYDDNKFEETMDICNNTSPYALTGSFFAKDRTAIRKSHEALKYAAGNFYINDKTTGACIGLQPFGGGRASGTNDKAGSQLNLLKWVSPRTVKEMLVPPRWYAYPFMEDK
jgi:1-pyrroline-5-carboxylate dehydrogenase